MLCVTIFPISIARAMNYSGTANDGAEEELVALNDYIDSADFGNLNFPFYLLYGIGHDRAARALTPHKYGFNGDPQISQFMVNPTTGEAVIQADTIRPALTRTHGILMWIAWPVLACTGIFFAMWMRPVLPGGAWFQVHRALMLASLVVACMGVVAIVASQYRSVPTKGLINFKDNVRYIRTSTAHSLVKDMLLLALCELCQHIL